MKDRLVSRSGILKRAGDLLPPLGARCAHVLIRCIPEEAVYARVFRGGRENRRKTEIPASLRRYKFRRLTESRIY